MNNIKELYNAIVAKREDASEELEAVDPRLRSGAEGRIRQAKIDVVTLEARYLSEIVKNVVVIAVAGAGAEDFGKIAEDKFKTISVDYFKILNDIASSVEHRGGRKTYSTNEHLMVLDELNKAKMTYGILRLPVLQPRFEVVGIDMPIRETLYKNLAYQYGSTLYTAVIKSEAARQALEKGFTGNTLALVVYNYDQELGIDTSILPNPAAGLLVSKEDVSETSVKKTLTQVRDSLKPKKQDQQNTTQDQQ